MNSPDAIPVSVDPDGSTPFVEKAVGHDWLTVGSLGLLAMCIVTCDHEALGHGGACVVLGGHIRILTSSVFRCTIFSPWVDFAGPATSFLLGTVALVIRTILPLRLVKARLFLIFVTAFSYFWEGGYLIHAMHRRNGDLYDFATSVLGILSTGQRWAFAALGLALYLFAVRITAAGLLSAGWNAKASRRIARIGWLAATSGAFIAGILGMRYGGLRDAIMEVGVASFPLLFIPRGKVNAQDAPSVPVIERSLPLVIATLIVYLFFAATLGHGIS